MTEHQIVKNLEWRRPPQSASLSRAETIIGTYRVWTHLEADGKWFWELQGASIERGDSADEAGAKQAAQAHFEAAVLSALSVSLPSLQERAEKEARIERLEAENATLEDRLSKAYAVKAECNDEANWQRARANKLEGMLNSARPLPFDRDELGRMVRESWVRWAQTQPSPKSSWLIPYDQLAEDDKEADRQIGEDIARWTLVGDAARAALSDTEASNG